MLNSVFVSEIPKFSCETRMLCALIGREVKGEKTRGCWMEDLKGDWKATAIPAPV